MICSIHQPNYIPYLGLFQKINQSDVFVFYDTAQYTKGDYHNRNKIKGPNGDILLTIPVNVSMGDKINDVLLNTKILNKHLKTIDQSYKKSEYYNEIILLLKDIYGFDSNNLSDFNIHFITKISEYLGITTQFLRVSDLNTNLELTGTEALVDICTYVGAQEYISGSGGKNYIKKEAFIDANIRLVFQDFKHPIYKQLWGDFIPYMSIIDLLFNEGKNSIKHL